METYNICKYCELSKSIDEFDKYKGKTGNILIRNRCIDCRKKYDIEYHKQNKEKKSQYTKNNREKINERRKKRFEQDSNYKIIEYTRARIRDALKNNAKKTKTKTKELLGCSIDELKLFLEYQFDKNMSWDNHGKYWSIDHVIPCASFDMSNIDEQKKCFHWTNLQPLSIKLNRQKSNIYDAKIIYEHACLVNTYKNSLAAIK
jgi:hypothetical protein